MDVFFTLFAHGGLPLRLPRLWRVVVADKYFGFRWQSQHFADGAVQRVCVAARKVGARRANVWHEQRVPDKNSIFDLVSHVSRGVTRDQHGHGLDVPNPEDFPILEQVVKLPAVDCKIGIKIEHHLESGLHNTNVFTNGDATANLLFEVVRT